MAFSPLISYGTKVRTGALVSKRPCEPCQISMPAPLAAAWKGNGMERRLEENSSLESPAISTLPSTYFSWVMVSMRGAILLRLVGKATDLMLDVGERDFGELAAGGRAQNHGNGIGAAAAGDGDVDVLGDGIDHHVLNQDLVGARCRAWRRSFR